VLGIGPKVTQQYGYDCKQLGVLVNEPYLIYFKFIQTLALNYDYDYSLNRFGRSQRLPSTLECRDLFD